MSTLYRLKAYFGMVPAEDLDDYGPDYRDDYRSGYESGYEDSTDHRSHAYATERPACAPRRPDGYRADSYGDDFAADSSGVSATGASATPHMPSARRPASWASDAEVHGALAVDTAPPIAQPIPQSAAAPYADPAAEDKAHPLARIVTLHPRSYSEARPIGERYREGTPVIMNLTGMDDKDAKRLVDFAAGLAFALRGSIDKVTNKVFLLSPPDVDVSAEDWRRIAEGRNFNQR